MSRTAGDAVYTPAVTTNDMLTLAEAGAELDRASSTLRWQIANGKLRATKYGKTYVISRRELERYRRESLRGAPATAE